MIRHRALLAGAFFIAFVCSSFAGETTVLDGRKSVWRTFIEWGSPVVLNKDGTTRGLIPRVHFWLASEWTGGKPETPWSSGLPGKDWNAVDHDDGDWEQERYPVGPDLEAKRWNHPGFTMWSSGSSSQVTTIFSRGRFKVEDPSKVKELNLRVEFHGGIIIYINGKELTRGHICEKSPGHGVRGEPYPDDVYVDKDGKQIVGKAHKKSKPEELAHYKKRVREITAKVPSTLLRKGVNVLAIELCRAPFKEVYRSKPKEYKKKMYCAWPWPWPHCRLLSLELTALDPAGVPANVGRPEGVQLWQPHPWETVTGFHYASACEPIRPIRLAGFRGGGFNARVVVSSSSAISGLKVTAGELKGKEGVIQGSNVSLGYAQPNGARFTALFEKPPSPVPVTHFKRSRRDRGTKAAAQPIWVTVNVPPDCKPGDYAGTVTVEAEGLKATPFPIEITVHDWQYPDVKDLATQNNMWQAHEIHAHRYKIAKWSDEHFKLIGKCLALSKPLANRFCSIPMTIGGFQCGNQESMVRWIKKDDAYDYDFTICDRYLDLYEKVMGKPRVLAVDVCVPIHSKSRPKDGSNPIKVSRLDPATKKVESMDQPPYGSPEGVAFWKPVLAEMKKRLEKRGWWDVALIGTGSDSGPTKGEAETFKTIWPDKGWIVSGHPRKTKVNGGVPIVSLGWVWSNGRLWRPSDKKRAYPRPWKNNFYELAFPRYGCSACTLKMQQPLRDFRIGAEINLQCGQDGMDRVGLDYWTFTDDRNRTWQLHTKGGQFSFDTAVPYFVAPGPDGPVRTTHGEMYREGLQVREAITFLLKAVDGGKLSAELVKEIDALTRKRAGNIDKIHGFRNWRKDEGELFALCAKVAGILKN